MKHMMLPLLFLLLPRVTMADVVVYDGDVLPEELGWEREFGGSPGCDRWVEDGWFYLFCDLPKGWEGPCGDTDYYRKPIGEFAGEQPFFVEWRAETDCPGSILEVSGTAAALSAYSGGAGSYHTTFTDDRVRLIWGGIPGGLIYLDIPPGMPHTYRVETYGEEWFAWYIDGEVVNDGVPEYQYPTAESGIIWGSRHYLFDTLTRYDYVRYGTIPADGSGDFDSDGQVDSFDFYYFEECLIGTGARTGHDCSTVWFDASTLRIRRSSAGYLCRTTGRWTRASGPVT